MSYTINWKFSREQFWVYYSYTTCQFFTLRVYNLDHNQWVTSNKNDTNYAWTSTSIDWSIRPQQITIYMVDNDNVNIIQYLKTKEQSSKAIQAILDNIQLQL